MLSGAETSQYLRDHGTLNFSPVSNLSKYCVTGLSALSRGHANFTFYNKTIRFLKFVLACFWETMAVMLRMLCQESDIILQTLASPSVDRDVSHLRCSMHSLLQCLMTQYCIRNIMGPFHMSYMLHATLQYSIESLDIKHGCNQYCVISSLASQLPVPCARSF